MDSAATANRYYDRIGDTGLASQTDEERTASELAALLEWLSPGAAVLDAACGYGRLAVPLAERGFAVSAVDLSAVMVSAAREHAERAEAQLDLHRADMRDLPFEDGSFEAVICLWSAFNSLLRSDEQLQALGEFHRVLRPGGEAFIDLPDGDAERWHLRSRGKGPDGHLVEEYFVGGGNAIYLHDTATAYRLCEESPFGRFEVSRERFGGRRRLIMRLFKD